jgi:hypothetical protein
MTTLRRLTGLIVCGCLSWAGPARADAVTDWNAISVPPVFQGRPGAIGFVDLALVQAAVHDAVQAIEGQFEPYHVKISGASGSPAAAAAAAAYGVLAGFYPDQAAALTATYQAYLIDNNLVNDPGLAVGQLVAAGIIPLRRLDPSPLPDPFFGGTNPGEWRPTPPSEEAPMAFHWLGAFPPFTLNCPAQFRADPPPALKSARYRRHYNEVKALGALRDSARTDQQTDLANFFAGNLVAILYQGLRDIATQQGLSISESARLLALCSLAIGDAVITAWDSKLYYNFWRPLTAIREGDNDTNHHTVGDTSWEPFVNTPPIRTTLQAPTTSTAPRLVCWSCSSEQTS